MTEFSVTIRPRVIFFFVSLHVKARKMTDDQIIDHRRSNMTNNVTYLRTRHLYVQLCLFCLEGKQGSV
jgi:hypothetical protein